ncbi:Fc.00g048680.m01.CDS01 [Cosmosporella sp. VM-42]
MQLTHTTFALSSLATLATATVNVGFQFFDTVALNKRQTSGPAYECHSNCGYTILNAKDEGYCDSADWQKLYETCLDCANQYDLWPDYGDGVKAAAEGCGLEAVPKGDAATSGATGTNTGRATASAVDETSATTSSDAIAPTTAVETSSAAPTSSSSAVHESTTSAAETFTVTSASTVTAVPTGSNSTTGAPSTATVSGGSAIQFSGVLALGVALMGAVSLM